MHTTPTHDTTL